MITRHTRIIDFQQFPRNSLEYKRFKKRSARFRGNKKSNRLKYSRRAVFVDDHSWKNVDTRQVLSVEFVGPLSLQNLSYFAPKGIYSNGGTCRPCLSESGCNRRRSEKEIPLSTFSARNTNTATLSTRISALFARFMHAYLNLRRIRASCSIGYRGKDNNAQQCRERNDTRRNWNGNSARRRLVPWKFSRSVNSGHFVSGFKGNCFGNLPRDTFVKE